MLQLCLQWNERSDGGVSAGRITGILDAFVGQEPRVSLSRSCWVSSHAGEGGQAFDTMISKENNGACLSTVLC